MNKNTLEKARKVQAIVAEHYEPERQDRCKRWVWKHRVCPVYPISERTFFRYLAATDEKPKTKDDPRQLRLFE